MRGKDTGNPRGLIFRVDNSHRLTEVHHETLENKGLVNEQGCSESNYSLNIPTKDLNNYCERRQEKNVMLLKCRTEIVNHRAMIHYSRRKRVMTRVINP